jgi:hypothetical protein
LLFTSFNQGERAVAPASGAQTAYQGDYFLDLKVRLSAGLSFDFPMGTLGLIYYFDRYAVY